MRNLPLRAGRHRWEEPQALVSAHPDIISTIHSNGWRHTDDVHHRVEVHHLPVIRGVQQVRTFGKEPVNLGLESHVDVRSGQQTGEHTRKGARNGIRTSHDGQDAVVDELSYRGRGILRKVFIVLEGRISDKGK